VSARIWLRIRAADRDVSWQDTNRYAYANQDERWPRTSASSVASW